MSLSRSFNVSLVISVCLGLILFSCSGKIMVPKNVNYNETPNRQFWSVDWSPDDKFIAVGGVDSLLRIYHAKDMKLYKDFNIGSWIHSIKWNPDNTTLGIATLDKEVQLLNLENGTITILNSNGGSRAIDWNFNGELMAVGDLEGVVKIWKKDGTLIKTFDKEYGPEIAGSSYLGIDWHPYKNIFVAVNFQIQLFDSTARELKLMEHTNKEAIMLCVNWHPTGSFFVIGDYGHNWDGKNIPSLLHFWSEEGRLIKSVAGSKGEYRNISWNKEGTRLATASDVLRVWSDTGTLLNAGKPDSSNYLWGIDWNAAGDRIITSSRFKTIALWDSKAKLLKRIDVPL